MLLYIWGHTTKFFSGVWLKMLRSSTSSASPPCTSTLPLWNLKPSPGRERPSSRSTSWGGAQREQDPGDLLQILHGEPSDLLCLSCTGEDNRLQNQTAKRIVGHPRTPSTPPAASIKPGIFCGTKPATGVSGPELTDWKTVLIPKPSHHWTKTDTDNIHSYLHAHTHSYYLFIINIGTERLLLWLMSIICVLAHGTFSFLF